MAEQRKHQSNAGHERVQATMSTGDVNVPVVIPTTTGTCGGKHPTKMALGCMFQHRYVSLSQSEAHQHLSLYYLGKVDRQ